MGNTTTKEQRTPPASRIGHARSASSPQVARPSSPLAVQPADPTSHILYTARQGRSNRSELSNFLGIGSNAERDTESLDLRKETKQEREARKMEKERVTRERERERSIQEENVDGGYLVTQGVYTGIEDYNKAIVRHLMIERRIAPFWRGLNDHSSSWTENQLVAAARALPIPAPDEIPVEEPRTSFQKIETTPRSSDLNINSLTVPITSRSPSYTSDSSSNFSPTQPTFSLSSSSAAASSLLRGRAKTLATLTTSSKNHPQPELMPREMTLPKDPYINGQHIEAYLYKDATECPICFLYYPPYLNRTRCCDQAICSECFVQIKRPDPHPPEHADPLASTSTVPESADHVEPDTLVSEPAACPFCVQPEFGITYDSPSFRRGLTYVSQLSSHPLAKATSAMSSSSSLGSFSASGSQVPIVIANRRRTTSLSANSPTVVTTDRVRPDWATKLSSARAHAARRSAAATALHTAAYLMGGRNGSPDSRNFGGLGRRALLRRGTGVDSPSGGTSSAHLNMLALMSERYGASAASRGESGENSPTVMPPPRGSSRRNRVDDLEEMMLMEAIRLSLASEDERQKREEKDAKRESKKKMKEDKKAEKAARRAGPYSTSTYQSTSTLDSPRSGLFSSDNGKGKAIQFDTSTESLDSGSPSQMSRSAPLGGSASDAAQSHLEKSRAQLLPSDSGSTGYKPSHLRTLSNVSSSTSSVTDSMPGGQTLSGSHSSFEASPSSSGINIPGVDLQETFSSATPPGGGAGLEPMFNFRSLAAMIGNDDKADEPSHIENIDRGVGYSANLTGDEIGSGHDSQGIDLEGEMLTPTQSNSASQDISSEAVANTHAAPHGEGGHTIQDYSPPTSTAITGIKEREVHVMDHEDLRRETGRV